MRDPTQGVYHRETCLCLVHVGKTNIRDFAYSYLIKANPSVVCDCKCGPCEGRERLCQVGLQQDSEGPQQCLLGALHTPQLHAGRRRCLSCRDGVAPQLPGPRDRMFLLLVHLPSAVGTVRPVAAAW